jgi:hypothetical protein
VASLTSRKLIRPKTHPAGADVVTGTTYYRIRPPVEPRTGETEAQPPCDDAARQENRGLKSRKTFAMTVMG